LGFPSEKRHECNFLEKGFIYRKPLLKARFFGKPALASHRKRMFTHCQPSVWRRKLRKEVQL